MNPVKRKIREGAVSFGSWIQIGHPEVAEILSCAGYDWIAADMEHSDMDIAAYTNLARGMYGRGPVPMARVRENDTMAIRTVLDAGAWGVIVPFVNSAADADKAVAAVKFPPRGIRGTAFFRANDYGTGFKDYMECADRETLVMVMCESRQAVENIDAIVAVDGVDGVFMGPYDLSLSYGIPGKIGDPVMVEARRKVLAACRKAGKAPGIHELGMTRESVKQVVDEGFLFIALGVDAAFVDRGAREALKNARDALAR